MPQSWPEGLATFPSFSGTWPLSHNAFRWIAKTGCLPTGIGVHLQTGTLFGITTEWCSASEGNRVHLRPGSPQKEGHRFHYRKTDESSRRTWAMYQMRNYLLNPCKYWVLELGCQPRLREDVTLVGDLADPFICKSLKRWRPRRDLNPCYRRESRPRVRN